MKYGSVANRLLSARSLASNSCGIPGSTYTFSICTVGKRTSPASLRTAPSGTSAILWPASSERSRKCSRMSRSRSGWTTRRRWRSAQVGPGWLRYAPARRRSCAAREPRNTRSSPEPCRKGFRYPPQPARNCVLAFDCRLLARSASEGIIASGGYQRQWGEPEKQRCLRRAGVVDVGRRRGDKLLQPALEPRFDLPHALAADAEARADLLQRLGILRQQPRLENLQLLARERRGELLDLVAGKGAPLAVGGFGFRVVPGVGDYVEQPCIIAGAGGLIERYLALAHPLLHLAHVAFPHTHPMRQQERLRLEAFALQPFGLFAEIEEQLALRLGGADLDQPPVVDQVAVDIRAHPPHRVRRKADSMFGVEILDRFHQA